MKAEFFRAFFLQNLISIKGLLRCHTVFCIPRIVHNVIADLEETARIKTAADRLRDMSDRLLKEINMCNIIQIDDCSQFVCQHKLLSRSVI